MEVTNGIAPETATRGRMLSSITASDGPASDEVTEHLPSWLGALYDQAGVDERLALLRALVPHLRPLAAAVVGGGAFSWLLHRGHEPEPELLPTHAERITGEQVAALARYVEQAGRPVLAATLRRLAGELGSSSLLAGALSLTHRGHSSFTVARVDSRG